MKSIKQDEIDAATFKPNASVKLSGKNEDKLLLAARRVIDGQDIEAVAQDVFNSSGGWIQEKIRDRVEKVSNGKEMQYIPHHRVKAVDRTEERFRRFRAT